jgi:hypothetical protein
MSLTSRQQNHLAAALADRPLATAIATLINQSDVTTPGTVEASKGVVLDANKDASGFRNLGATGAITLSGGAAAAATVLRLGDTATEGLEVKVIDEIVTTTNAVETNLTNTVPSGAVILSVQANLNSVIAGDASGDNLGVKVGIGVTATPDKYGITSGLTKNLKVDTLPDWAVLGGAETICVKLAKTDGAAATEKFVAGGFVRVRIVYLTTNSLDDAA